MSKNPISILQEYQAKNCKSLPIYNCVSERIVGTNDHEFTFRVTCENLSAEGKGLTKQEAKRKSAEEMLLLIGYSERVAVDNVDNVNVSSPSTSGTNYVGLLHEFCVQKRVHGPVFIEVNSFGPSHLMQFTIKCEVADISEEATAKSKKQAKTDAAQKVWFKLENRRLDKSITKTIENELRELEVEITDLKLEEILSDYKEQHENAEKKYLNLTKMKISDSISDHLSINECHQFFISNYSLSLRENIFELLRQIDTTTKNIDFLSTYISVLEKVSKLLNVKLEKIILKSRKSALESMYKIKHTVGYKLFTMPMIVSFGTAETLALAELDAIFDFVYNLNILML